MNNTSCCVTAVAALLATVGAAVAGGPDDVAARLDLNARSAYVWRGITCNSGPVLQPSAEAVLACGTGVRLWANFDASDYKGVARGGDVSEIDLTAFHTLPFGRFRCTAGVTAYTYDRPGIDPDTAELFAEIVTVLRDVVLSGRLFYDVDEVQDYYAALTVGYGFEPLDALDVNLAVDVGYAGDDTAAGGNAGWNDVTAALGVSYNLRSGVTLGASVAHTERLDNDTLPEVDVNTHAGLHATWRF
jgi:hypothetical protein